MDKLIGLETAKVIILDELKKNVQGSIIQRVLSRLEDEIDAENDAIEKEFCGE